jgi:hypothetical protein
VGLLLRVVTASGEVLVEQPLAAEATWEIVWLHSVAQVEIRDLFAWRDGAMLLTDHFTPLLDIAGLGATPGRGVVVADGAGGFHVRGIDARLAGDVHRFMIGSAQAPSRLIVAGSVFALSETHPGVRARIEVIEP